MRRTAVGPDIALFFRFRLPFLPFLLTKSVSQRIVFLE
jgi:hypothetical protein